MIRRVVEQNEAGQRSDKFLKKLFPLAPSSLIYKWLRKKSITCNGKKMDGSEKLLPGDLLTFFLSEETYLKFQQNDATEDSSAETDREYRKWSGKIEVIYRDDDVLFLNKPAGILSQKGTAEDYSVTDYVRDYCLKNDLYTREELKTFHPAAVNRLDRNTSGLILCGISLSGLQKLSYLISERSLIKVYRAIVKGRLPLKEGYLTGIHQKDPKRNQVIMEETKIFADLPGAQEEYEKLKHSLSDKEGDARTGRAALTGFRLLEEAHTSSGDYSMVEVTLYTGYSHQIRAHFSSVGLPLLGDPKYGREVQKGKGRMHGREATRQMLHAERLTIPEGVMHLPALSGKTFTAEIPEDMRKLWKALKGET